MTRCCVSHCNETGHHVFPKDIKQAKLWLKAIRRPKFKPTKFSRLCPKHFTENDYETLSKHTGLDYQHKYLKKAAVPSIFPWNIKEPTKQATERAQRVVKRNIQKTLFLNKPSTSSGSVDIKEHIPPVSIEVEVKASDIIAAPDHEDRTLEPRNMATQTSNILRLFSTEMLLSDNRTVSYYTGLESPVKFSFVLSTLLPMAHDIQYRWHRVQGLSVEDQFLMLLIKLKHNRSDFELGKMFGVSKTEVSNVVVTWINFVSDIWSLIDIWPSRKLIDFYMPDKFKSKYSSTRLIVDGTEIPIQKPSHPVTQRATFSSYKHKNTLKFLVGAAPGGLMTYCSEAYAGSVSDRQIIERSNLMQCCERGDSIMADRGFNVQDIFASKGIGINIPTFLKGKSQIPGFLLKEDHRLASVRVHIERLIGLTKTYKILSNDLNKCYIPLASKIFFICMMLCNFREGIVNKK